MANRRKSAIPEGDELGLQEAVNYGLLHSDPVYPDATIDDVSEQASEGEE